MIKPIFEEKYLSCYLDDAVPVLAHKWHGFTTGDQLRSGLLRCLDQYKQLRGRFRQLHWLSNSSDLKAIAPKDIDWLNGEWSALLYAGGVKRVAFVVPRDIFASLAIDKYTQHVGEHYEAVQISYFELESAANEWLKMQ